MLHRLAQEAHTAQQRRCLLVSTSFSVFQVGIHMLCMPVPASVEDCSNCTYQGQQNKAAPTQLLVSHLQSKTTNNRLQLGCKAGSSDAGQSAAAVQPLGTVAGPATEVL